MAMTNAAKQAAFRQRRDARIREMEEANERLRNGAEWDKVATWAQAIRFAVRDNMKGEHDAAGAAAVLAMDDLALEMEFGRFVKRLIQGERADFSDEERRADEAEFERLRNAAKVEEPRPEGAALIWVDVDHGDGGRTAAIANTPAGDYRVYRMGSKRGPDFSFLAALQPKGWVKDRRLGTFPTLAEAKAACEQHARAVT